VSEAAALGALLLAAGGSSRLGQPKQLVTVDGQVHRLGPGDAYYFDSRLPHRFRALGAEPVEAVSVNSPPSF